MNESKGSILVVDDEPDMVNMLALALRRRGYEITTVTEAARALSLVSERLFDVVISDFKMPDMTGLELTSRLKRINPSLKVIIATGYATDDTFAACCAAGASEYIRKPYTIDQLEALL